MRTLLYEDHGWQRLLPLVYVRGVFQLVCGASDLLAKVRRLAAGRNGAANLGLWCRQGIAPVVTEQTGLASNEPAEGATLFLNGRGLWTRLPEADLSEGAWVGVVGDDPYAVACIAADAELAARLAPEVLLDEARTRAALAGLPRRDVSDHVELITWPWELIHRTARLIETEWSSLMPEAGIHGQVDTGSYVLNEAAVHIGAGTRIKPCVVIDAEEGPVYIGENVTVLPHAYIQGPAYIGDGSLVQSGAVIRDGAYIGPVCKVGGEIEASIIQGFSNKQHDGFLGHSYVCSWVNIAADCINSDLKNTYGTIRVPLNGYEVDTGEMFMGMLVGDHSKAGINVSFPTGAVIGFCSSIFAPMSPKFVPSFAWITGRTIERYDEQRGLDLARRVMARRKKIMSDAEERAFLSVTRQALALERQELGVE